MEVFEEGKLNAYFPASVIHGMLASIGTIIMPRKFMC